MVDLFTHSVPSEIANNGWQFHNEFTFALVILNIITTPLLA